MSIKADPRIDCDWDRIPASALPKVEQLASLVMAFVSALVDREDKIQIDVSGNHRRVMFTVRVDENDVKFAIGSKGTHANALRIILLAACRKLDFHFDMDIIGPTGEADWSSS